jgi:hypothetical protein
VQREQALALVRNLPLDDKKPLELVVAEHKPPRKPDQNALYHAGPLKDCAEQIWLEGKQYSSDVLHEYFKRQFLPEEYTEDECLKGYSKWSFDPSGERVLVGSTTKLTVRGFSIFLEQVLAFGASFGVQFHASPNERQS